MIEKKIVIEKVTEFATTQIDKISKGSNMITLLRPFITRAVNIKIGQLNSILSVVTDKDGMVDIEGMLNEFVDNLLVTQVQKHPSTFGETEIGEGQIKWTVPGLGKQIVIDTSDIEELKQLITNPKN